MRDHVEILIDQESYYVIDTIKSMAAMMRAEKASIKEIFVQQHRSDTSVYLLDIDSLQYALWFLSNTIYVRRVGSVWGPLFGFYILTRAGDDLTIGKIGFNRQLVKSEYGFAPPSILRYDRSSSKISGYSNYRFHNIVKLVADPSKWPKIKKFAETEFKGKWNASYSIILNEFNSRIYWLEIATEKTIDSALLTSADSCGIFT